MSGKKTLVVQNRKSEGLARRETGSDGGGTSGVVYLESMRLRDVVSLLRFSQIRNAGSILRLVPGFHEPPRPRTPEVERRGGGGGGGRNGEAGRRLLRILEEVLVVDGGKSPRYVEALAWLGEQDPRAGGDDGGGGADCAAGLDRR